VRLVVVGAGVVGLAIALEAAARGCAVTMVDGGAERDASASLGNAGLIVPSHVIPLAAPGVARKAFGQVVRRGAPIGVRMRPDRELGRWLLAFRRAARAEQVDRAAPVLRDLLLASRAGFEEWARFGDIGLQRRGVVLLCLTPHALEEEVRNGAFARRLGLAADVLDRAGVERLDPALAGPIAGGVHVPADWHLDPVRLLATLRAEARRRGVVTRWGVRALGFRSAGDVVRAVQTADEELVADVFVVAAGAATPHLVRRLGLELPLLGGRGYGLEVAPGPPMPRVPAILHEPRVAVTPLGDRLRFTGVFEIGQRTATVAPRRLAGMRAGIEAFLPAWAEGARQAEPWAALRPCTPDGLPYVGHLPGYANALVASGHCMLGLTLAPVTGRLVAALAHGEAPPLDTTGLDPARYARRANVSRTA
jgi:D-amino-acid dehydrogenase